MQDPKWFLIDATNKRVGRLASKIAHILQGKHKSSFAPNKLDEDHLIVINAEKVRLTGRKRENKVYYRHTGYPGGIKSRTAGGILESKFPERVVVKAVERMIPRTPLGRQQVANLRVYAGAEHPHVAQDPQVLDIGAMNEKNRRRA